MFGKNKTKYEFVKQTRMNEIIVKMYQYKDVYAVVVINEKTNDIIDGRASMTYEIADVFYNKACVNAMEKGKEF